MNNTSFCPKTHARKILDGPHKGAWRSGGDGALGVYTGPQGGSRYRIKCRSCRTMSGDIPNAVAENMIRSGRCVEWHTDNRHCADSCAYLGCTNFAIQWASRGETK